MARSNEFTHGGSVGKNLGLLLRAIANVIAFALLFFGISQLGAAAVLFGLPSSLPLICTILGGVLTALFLYLNLFAPFAHRVK